MDHYTVIGIMSGTSLDGVDLACCHFEKNPSGWKFEIGKAMTAEYTDEWMGKLSSLHQKDAETFALTNSEYGHFLGNLANNFMSRNQLKADFIASHGHTIFHQPQKKFTFQLGHGASLSAAANIPVVCDFRSTDVALGGQGAPLVPVGDKLLFGAYQFCLNLGGIANISFDHLNERVAFDVSPCNLVMNNLAMELGKKYDDEGQLAERGQVDESLLSQLNACDYYRAKFPKSLGREDVEKIFFPLINAHRISVEDKLRTFSEHLAIQIVKVINGYSQSAGSRLFITGGGALNKSLIGLIEKKSSLKIIVPDRKIIEYKEALIFAFLGVLRWRGEVNCLKSVTGAEHNHCSGAIYL